MTKSIKKAAKKKVAVKVKKKKLLANDKIKSINASASDDGVITYKISKEMMQCIISFRDNFSISIANGYKGTYIKFLTESFIEFATDSEYFSNLERLALLHEMLTATNTKNWFYNVYFGQFEYYYSYIADKKEKQIEQHLLYKKLK